jgi:hypothetical protein
MSFRPVGTEMKALRRGWRGALSARDKKVYIYALCVYVRVYE